MKRNFVLTSDNDKPTVPLEVVGNGEAICIKCGEPITRSMVHIWRCDKCKREYSGPMLRS